MGGRVLKFGLIAALIALALVLMTNHWGFAIRLSSYIFVFLLVAIVWRLKRRE